jgi:hypothetical protein
LKTECNRKPIRFHPQNRREIVGRFDGGTITSDGGVVLLREADRRSRVIEQFAGCFRDHRDPDRVRYGLKELLAQRVYALALGYEDLNDHDELRYDKLLSVAVGEEEAKPLAGKSTLNRLELSVAEEASGDRYKKIAIDPEKVEQLFVDLFLEAHATPPEEIILDLDATDDPLHGEQEGRFFHGFYMEYCYLPLYIFCGEHLLCAKLRPSNIDASAGSVEELDRIVKRIRAAWPTTRIVIRADSGFCRDEILTWCEAHDVRYIVGIAKNDRLKAAIAQELAEAKALCEATQQPERVFKDFRYETHTSWTRERRIIGKAEVLPQGENPRFIVTDLEGDARWLYEEVYCARGEMENRIKEQQLYLFADHTSSHFMGANQIRLWLSSVAYTLLQTLRRVALQGTRLAKAQCHTIRLKLLKIGAQIRITVRKVWIAFSEAYPYAELFAQAYKNLQRWRAVPT